MQWTLARNGSNVEWTWTLDKFVDLGSQPFEMFKETPYVDLGLVRKIVEASGGVVEITSSRKDGTRIVLRWPLSAVPAATRAQAAAA